MPFPGISRKEIVMPECLVHYIRDIAPLLGPIAILIAALYA